MITGCDTMRCTDFINGECHVKGKGCKYRPDYEPEQRETKLSDSLASHGIVCMFCGEGFGYEGQTPDEATLKSAADHERECPKNPYKARIASLEGAIKSLLYIFDKGMEPGMIGYKVCAYARAILEGNESL